MDLIDKIKEDESDETAKIIIRNESNKPRLTIEKKGFNLHDDHDAFFNNRTEQVGTSRREERHRIRMSGERLSMMTDPLYFRPVCLISNRRPSPINYSNTRKPFPRGLNPTRSLFIAQHLFVVSSYPYSEEHHEARSYLRARCPAWCDRILLSHLFKESVDTEVRVRLDQSSAGSQRIVFIHLQVNRPTYDLMGRDVCVGDHKVGVRIGLHSNLNL